MAKSKPKDDFLDEDQADGLVDTDREKQELLAELERLRKQLAGIQSAPMIDAPEGNVGDYWRINLEHAPTHVVQAKDPANAWDVYCAELGVRSSEFRPEVVPATREEYRAAQAKRHGKAPAEYALPDDPKE